MLQGGNYESMIVDHVHRIVMRLTLRPVTKRDFGEYKCIAKNAMGETERSITLHRKGRGGSSLSIYYINTYMIAYR